MDRLVTPPSSVQGSPETPSASDPTADSQRAFVVLLFNKYRGALLRHVEHFVKSREDAAELVQETFLRAMNQVETSRLEQAARGYLFQTATNLARDHIRRQRVRAHDRLDEVSEFRLPPGGAPPDQVIAGDQLLARLRASILAMSPATRAVFLRAKIDQQNYVQIGRALGMSVRTVERRMAEAMDVLCAQFQGLV